MKKIIVGIFALATTLFLSGCAIKHPVAKDYGPYLQKSAAVDLPKTSLKSAYVLDSKTQNHRYEFRAATVGYAHLWIVEFGQILDQTLNAKYVQSAFGELHKSTGQDSAGNLISFSLDKYEFKDYRAYVTLKVTLTDAGKTILEKSYSAEGNSQGGQMWAAGPFGMKNATLESTKFAIDSILKKFIADIPKN